MKKVIAMLVSFCLMSGVVCHATTDINVSVGGSNISFTDAFPFVDENDRTQVPVRALAEALGCDVQWNEVSQEVTLIKEYTEVDNISAQESTDYVCSKELHIVIGNTEYDGSYNTATKGSTTVSGCEWQGIKTMDTAPVIVSGRTYLPARYVAEFFGYTVEWDANSHTVIVK